MKLWAKNVKTDELMEKLTVGDDREHDTHLFSADCLASAAHARVLFDCNILSKAELTSLITALKKFHDVSKTAKVVIPNEFEDVHSYLEHKLTEEIGDAGKKIHTGRSRNDQVLVASRLFIREATLKSLHLLGGIAKNFSDQFSVQKDIVMPGYTHLQPAMPTTVGAWLHAFLEGTLELIREGMNLLTALNTNPLGAAAGFGSSLPLNREVSAKLLGFDRAQRSFIDIQNSRGRYEDKFLYWTTQIGALFEKFAWDVEIFCTKEFGFVTLPVELTTGSSIMPQKKNPDIVELLRARSSLSRGIHTELQWVAAKLPSNYHRDYQLTKGPLMRGLANIEMVLQSMLLLVPNIAFNLETLKSRIHPELFATYEAYKLVKKGTPFREAYKQTAALAETASFHPADYENEFTVLKDEVERYFRYSLTELDNLKSQLHQWEEKLSSIPANVFVVQ